MKESAFTKNFSISYIINRHVDHSVPSLSIPIPSLDHIIHLLSIQHTIRLKNIPLHCNEITLLFYMAINQRAFCLYVGFSLSNWMNEQGLSLEGSLSTALSDSLFKLLGIDSFMKEKACSRSEPPYSINKLRENGWSSGPIIRTVYYVHYTL